jgi:hypothetical protein
LLRIEILIGLEGAATEVDQGIVHIEALRTRIILLLTIAYLIQTQVNHSSSLV